MSNQPPKFEKIKELYGAYPKPMMVNLEVAKTMPFKTQTRRLKTTWKARDVLWVREPVKVEDVFVCHDRQQTILSFNYISDNEYKQIKIPERYNNYNQPNWLRWCQRVPNGCIKEMARTFLRVVEVREEFLQDIGYNDITKEGYVADGFKATDYDKKRWWINLWNSTAPKSSKWSDNPKVKVIVFEEIEV